MGSELICLAKIGNGTTTVVLSCSNHVFLLFFLFSDDISLFDLAVVIFLKLIIVHTKMSLVSGIMLVLENDCSVLI